MNPPQRPASLETESATSATVALDRHSKVAQRREITLHRANAHLQLGRQHLCRGDVTIVIAFAPFRLRQGITQEGLVAASDVFEELFVQRKEGILRRILVRDGEDGFAGVVFFEDDAAIRRVVEAEQNSEVCAAFFSIMDGEDQHRLYEVIKTYEPVPTATP